MYVCVLPFDRGFPFEQKDFDDLAAECAHGLRDGTHDLLELTNKTDVPVLVFSAGKKSHRFAIQMIGGRCKWKHLWLCCIAGLGDSIVAVLQHEKILYPNVKVVSNFLNFNNGIVNGFTKEYPMIHTFNKNETVLQGTEYYEMVHNRQHVILMGWVRVRHTFCWRVRIHLLLEPF